MILNTYRVSQFIMADEIYNKKALENIKTPDKLNDYIKVANPGWWILLVAVLVLLIGALIWAIFGKLYVTVTVPTFVEDRKGISLVSESRINSIDEGMPICINSVNGYISHKGYTGQKISDIATMYGINSSESSPADTAYIVTSNIDIDNGMYNAEIAIEEVQPISFLFH